MQHDAAQAAGERRAVAPERREGASPDERATIAKARAEAVQRYLVEVMGHPPEHYELRPMTPADVAFTGIHNRRVQLESIFP